MKIELHMIQNFPPSCLNRDDTGSPKDCEFGGVRRARISSQCIKRAIRWHAGFREHLSDALSVRSLRFPTQVRDELLNLGVSQDEADAVGKALQAIAKKDEKTAGQKPKKDLSDPTVQPDVFKTPQIAFYTEEEVKECAKRIHKLLLDGTEPRNIVKKLLEKRKGEPSHLPPPRTADIALFGRMITSDAFKNIDAACQVAHAISTHKVSMEMDFFTAVDDLKPADEGPGAGMMGVVGYNSACFYRYAALDWQQLVTNLGKDMELARKTVEAFLRASAFAVPSGKQNTFAAHSRPDFVLAVVRGTGAPLSLANAFVRPARPLGDRDLTQVSVDQLADYWKRVTSVYGADGLAAQPWCGVTLPSECPCEWQSVPSLDELVSKTLTALDSEG